MKGKYIPPILNGKAFNCPVCHVYSKHDWYFLRASENETGFGMQHEDGTFRVSYCKHCSASTIWKNDKIIYPINSIAEPANLDMPKDIIEDYEEAASVFSLSPRSSAALLRLAIQKLCKHLGESGENINQDIKNLVSKGLPPKVQQSLDSVRVIGNEAVHPGTLNLNDNREIAASLFKLVNFIATKMISELNEIDDIYNSLPEEKKKWIEDRDGKK
jgi:hypothetical protein